jgi:hypothetical protein
MVSQFDGQSRAAEWRPPESNASEVLTVDLAIDLADVERCPEKSHTGDDVWGDGSIVPEVPAAGESTQPG